MNKLTLSFIAATVALAFSYSLNAQAPAKMSYQAVIRNTSNNLVTNTAIGMQISILQGSASGSAVYVETHVPTTNANGLSTVEIGAGTVVTGNFLTINWANGPYYLKTETDPTGGTNYTITGASQLLSVPYALYAKSSGNFNGVAGGDLTGNYPNPSIANGAITANKLNQMNADTGEVLKWNGNTWAPTTDSSNILGWALSGNSGTDSTHFIGTKDDKDLHFKVNNIEAGIITSGYPRSTAIGQYTLVANTSGLYNSAFGYKALHSNTSGLLNTAIGHRTLHSNTTGDYNTASGAAALEYNTTGSNNSAHGFGALFFNATGDYNTANGAEALYFNTTGNYNTANGYQALYSNTTGDRNTAVGYQALDSNTTGYDNTAVGVNALENNTTGNGNTAIGVAAMQENTTGYLNTTIGFSTLFYNTTGDRNVAIGAYAINSNTSGNYNTAVGTYAMNSNTSGDFNTGLGYVALSANTSGVKNTAVGGYALGNNITGNYNTANGYQALFSNTTGDRNTAIGYQALDSNTTGYDNTAIGLDALEYNATGYQNTATGTEVLQNNTVGSGNTAIGHQALFSNTNGDGNTASGNHALSSQTYGLKNTAIGFYALDNLNGINPYRNTGLGANVDITDNAMNSTAIGFNAYVYGSNKIVLGMSTITSIGGYTTWSNLSDARFKTNMQPVSHGLDFIMKLEPITYHYNMQKLEKFMEKREGEAEEKDPEWLDEAMAAKAAIQYSGFSAQQVEKAAQAVGYNFSGVHAPENELDHYTLAYAEFVVPLVKAVQEQQQIIKKQNVVNEKLQKRIDELENTLKTIKQRLAALEAN